jgi:hypothetical protein
VIRLIRSDSGMSILQVLIAAAITAMTGIFTLQMVLQMKKVEALMTLQSEANDIERNVQRVLVDPLACFNTIEPFIGFPDSSFPLLTKDIPSINGPEIVPGTPPTPKPLISKSEWFANKQLQLNSINLVRMKPGDPTPPPFEANAVVTIFIELEFLKKSNKVGERLGGDYIKRWVPLSIHTNSTKGVAECSAVNKKDLASDLCAGLGLVYDTTLQKCPLLGSDLVKQTACNALGLGFSPGSGKCN